MPALNCHGRRLAMQCHPVDERGDCRPNTFFSEGLHQKGRWFTSSEVGLLPDEKFVCTINLFHVIETFRSSTTLSLQPLEFTLFHNGQWQGHLRVSTASLADFHHYIATPCQTARTPRGSFRIEMKTKEMMEGRKMVRTSPQ